MNLGRNKGTNRTMMRRRSNGTSKTTMTRRRDGASRTMMRGYNGNSRGWNETATRKKRTKKMSYRNTTMTTIFVCTKISHLRWDTHGTNKITKVTGITNKPRSTTINGNVFLIVGVPTRTVPRSVPITLVLEVSQVQYC